MDTDSNYLLCTVVIYFLGVQTSQQASTKVESIMPE